MSIMKLNVCVNTDCISVNRYAKHMKENGKIHIEFTAIPGAQHSALMLKKRVGKSPRFNNKILSLNFFVLACFRFGFGFCFVCFVLFSLSEQFSLNYKQENYKIFIIGEYRTLSNILCQYQEIFSICAFKWIDTQNSQDGRLYIFQEI